MGRANECCNPLNKKNHRCIRNNLFLGTKKWDASFKNCVGSHICKKCRSLCYSQEGPYSPMHIIEPHRNEEDEMKIEETEIGYESVTDSIKLDPNYKCEKVDNSLKTNKVNALLLELGQQPLIKKPSMPFTTKDEEKIIDAIDDQRKKSNDSDNAAELSIVKNIKTALDAAGSTYERIKILDWNTSKICQKLGVSRRLVLSAIELRKKAGYAVQPQKRVGKRLPDESVQRVTEFFYSDTVSRILPGITDCKIVFRNGKKVKAQKRLLLYNLDDLYEQFRVEFPATKLAISKFRELRPRECISAGRSGTHNVCVCKTHQNMKIKAYGLKRELKKKGIYFTKRPQDFVKNSLCTPPLSKCSLIICKNCPGVQNVANELLLFLTDNNIKEISYNQWTNTDRANILEVTEGIKEFVKNFEVDLKNFAKHTFLAKSQADYCSEKKKYPEDGEFIVTLDYSENYTFHIQNAIQSYHWTNSQATIHPYVIYFRHKRENTHLNYVIVSENLVHDTKSIHLFNKKMINFLKIRFGAKYIKKLVYFSDGAAGQYKNKFNFINLTYHKKDFGVPAEWNFYATSHGKSACDGIGGVIKRLAYKASLQRVDGNPINMAKTLFEWADGYFKNISSEFCSQSEHDSHDRKLKIRFSKAITIKNTRQYHHFIAIDHERIRCKLFSNDESFADNAIIKIKKSK